MKAIKEDTEAKITIIETFVVGTEEEEKAKYKLKKEQEQNA